MCKQAAMLVSLMQVTRLARQVHKFERGLPPNKITPDLRETVTQWQEILPVCAALRNTNLRERHWEAVADLLHNHINKTECSTLDEVLQLGVCAQASKHCPGIREGPYLLLYGVFYAKHLVQTSHLLIDSAS